MNKKIRTTIAAAAILLGGTGLAACDSDSDVASRNLSKDSDNYKIYRQIVVYNSITDKYILEVRGFCSLGNNDSSDQVSYTCRKPSGKIIKDIIKKSDNTFVFVHQLSAANVSTSRYKVIFKPSTVVPDVDVR